MLFINAMIHTYTPCVDCFPYPANVFSNVRCSTTLQGLDGGGGAAGLLSSSLQGMTTVTAFNMQEKLAEDYKQASEVCTTF